MSHLLARFTHPLFRSLALVAAAGAWLGSAALHAAEPAQVPLTSRVAEPPTPNAMVTLDDSGSMLADFMPEGTITLNGWTGRLSDPWVAAFPGDWRKICSSGASNCTSPPSGWAWAIGTYAAGTATSLKGVAGENNYQRRFRSPDVNKIYYNPDVLYLPWQKPDGTGRMPNATPSAARLDPTINTSVFNLTIRHTGKTRWFTGPGSGDRTDTTYDFYPGLVYRLKTGLNPDVAANFVRYDVNASDGTHAAAIKHSNRTDCLGTKCTRAEERQNFANWFTYYRMRESLTKGAVSESLSTFKDKLRVGWGRINKTDAETIDGVSFRIIENEAHGGPMRKFNSARMNTVLDGMQKMKSWQTTPLRSALDEVGRYFDGRGAGSPWLEDPTNTESTKLACRRSVSLLMTDGYYNDSYSGSGDVDGVNGPVYSGDQNPNNYTPTQYKAERPFIDGPPTVSNTLADVASKYYVKDLDNSIDNKVWPITGDIAYWQHLTQFMVGLGVYGTLDSTKEKKADTLAKLKAGTLKWPNPTAGSPQKIDDMWHAAVNTGGDFYSVSNVTELTEALSEAFGKAAGNEAKEAGVATASASVVTDNVKYVPKYKSVSWYGDLEALKLGTDGLEGTLIWSASAHLPAHADRSLFTWDPSLGEHGEPVAFTWDGMGPTNRGRVGTPELANYIRGESSNEGSGKTFRSRDGKYLGDFVNSPPVVVRGKLDLGYSAFDSTYADFVARKQARGDSAIVVGGNAGAIHAFRGVDGTEVYGYLPHEGLPNLKDIAAKDYGTKDNFHRFFVDGPMNETDAKISTRRNSSPEWANLVIGSMGAGGKAFFAMHIPTDFGSTLDADDFGSNTLLWEKSGSSDPDIGYIFADFAVGRIKGGGWKAFVGNGVYSSNGNAVLLVVDMATGKVDKSMTVAATGDTGLMGVTLIKDASQEVVGAYAGDLKGNVWRFDFEGTDVESWKIGFKGKPLFSATDPGGVPQPITVPPVFVDHPKQGRVVLFGSGKLIDETDSESTQRQTYYGVWDNVKIGESSAGFASPFESVTEDRSRLVAHSINKDEPKKDDGGTFYEVITSDVNWDTHLGWLVDLPWDRQRVIYPSIILSGAYVYFSTMVPAAPAGRCDPTTGLGFNFLLEAASGKAPTVPVLDTNGDGIVNDEDEIASGFLTRSDGRDAILIGGKDNDDGTPGGIDKDCKGNIIGYWVCNTEQQCKKISLPPASCPSSTVVDRVWKQILTPPIPE